MCVGSDTAALEVTPAEGSAVLFPCHTYLLAAAGAQIIEVLDLEELAAADQHEFAFFGFPLRLRGSTGSPLRAVAVPLRS
jgi:kynurenine formamidase